MTRGERNLNPGNIRIGMPLYQGEVMSTDPQFRQFQTMQYGIRAIAEILLAYQKHHGLNTIREFITRWAPPSDNNPTDAYITNVCNLCGFDADAHLDMHIADDQVGVITGIITQENGGLGTITQDDITAAVQLALA